MFIAADYEKDIQKVIPNFPKMVESYSSIFNELTTNLAELRIFDLGAGTGTWLKPIKKLDQIAEVIAVDLDKSMLDQLNKWYQASESVWECRVLCSDAMRVLDETEAQSIDVIVSGYMLHHFAENKRTEFFAKVRRVLKPNGFLLNIDLYNISNSNKQENLSAQEDELEHIHKMFINDTNLDFWENHYKNHRYLVDINSDIAVTKKLGFSDVSSLYRYGQNQIVLYR
jgi:ubiquinone/menaquinone biosynthesis C-methylase UbiE